MPRMSSIQFLEIIEAPVNRPYTISKKVKVQDLSRDIFGVTKSVDHLAHMLVVLELRVQSVMKKNKQLCLLGDHMLLVRDKVEIAPIKVAEVLEEGTLDSTTCNPID